MFNIQKFLEKFRNNLLSDELVKKQIIDIVRSVTKLELLVSEVEVKNNAVLLSISPAQKNKIFIFKNRILEEIAKSVPKRIVDIR